MISIDFCHFSRNFRNFGYRKASRHKRTRFSRQEWTVRCAVRKRLILFAKIYQELYPKFEFYPEAVRQAKRLKGLTIDALVESAGVSYSSVSRLCDGTQLDPKLFNSVALCKVLGLSMDEIFGLSASEASAEELQAKLHAAELENARLAEENKRLHEVNRLRAE